MPEIFGTDEDDILYGTPDGEDIFGYGGNDIIYGRGGPDSIFGGSGDDIIRLAWGNPVSTTRGNIDGGSGTDVLDLSGAGTTYFAAPMGFGRSEIYVGGQSYIVVNIERWVLSGGGDVVGLDTIGAPTWVDGGAGDDQIIGGANAATILGGAGNDVLASGGRADRLFGGEGDDALYVSKDGRMGGYRAIEMFGGDGDDIVYYNEFTLPHEHRVYPEIDLALLSGDSGVDALVCLNEPTNVNLLAGQLERTFYNYETRAIEIRAVARINGFENAHTAAGDLIGDGGSNRLSLDGFGSVWGGDGDDIIVGGAGANNLFGGAENDIIEGGFGDDVIDGGEGIDTVTFQSWRPPVESLPSVAVTINLLLQVSQSSVSGFDTLRDVENVIGTAFADVIIGDAEANILYGMTGNDRIEGGEGDDVLEGGGGSDFIQGGSGADTLDGGEGIDTASYWNSSAGVTVNLQTGSGLGGDADGDVLFGIENLDGSSFNDLLVGNAHANTLRGGLGDDTLRGGLGDDVLDGGAGLDVAVFSGLRGAYTITYSGGSIFVTDPDGSGELRNVEALQFSNGTFDVVNGVVSADARRDLAGGQSNDNLNGGGSNDTLRGYGGNDTLRGMGGDDLLDGGSGSDTMRGGSGNDVYEVDSGGDQTLELLGEGVDTVRSSVNRTLGDHLENLVLLGSAVNGYGNGLANQITGSDANNFLYGRAGNDTVSGGLGDDRLFGD
ncbi:calcium-binding protein, partial [Brevundimonas sp.]|uniref:calcium-binding protein n=1 Tax=Brevundimonas sp. TaxID=1871086 RepID=UPI0025D14216